MNNKKYWCFICNNQFQFQSKIVCTQCPVCHEQAFQQQDENSKPSQFQIYNCATTSRQTQQSSSSPQHQANFTFFSNITPNSQQGQGISILSIGNNNQNPTFSFGSFTGNANTNLIFNNAMILANNMLNSLPPNFYSTIDNLIMQLVNSGRSYRPATPQEIDQLQKISKPSQCGICQCDESTEENGYKLKCGHQFHQGCLRPWLEQANTCPMCRNTI